MTGRYNETGRRVCRITSRMESRHVCGTREGAPGSTVPIGSNLINRNHDGGGRDDLRVVIREPDDSQKSD